MLQDATIAYNTSIRPYLAIVNQSVANAVGHMQLETVIKLIIFDVLIVLKRMVGEPNTM